MEKPLHKRASEQEIVFMTAATWSQKDILSNFLCNLARLDIRNYVVAALDQTIFNWAAVRGHGVFLFPPHKENLKTI